MLDPTPPNHAGPPSPEITVDVPYDAETARVLAQRDVKVERIKTAGQTRQAQIKAREATDVERLKNWRTVLRVGLWTAGVLTVSVLGGPTAVREVTGLLP